MKEFAPTEPNLSLEDRIRRKRRRNRWLILISPILLPFLPVLLPIYFLTKKRGETRTRIGDLSGSLATVLPASLKDAEEARIDALPDSFALCRIIGNDLAPRHKKGQSISNVRFILENEPEFENCTKIWLLNRIFNSETEAQLVSLLEEHGQEYHRIPFVVGEFQTIGYDFTNFEDPMIFANGRLDRMDAEGYTSKGGKMRAILQAYKARNNYVMNNNEARNTALELCLKHAKWALPFDGNCFFTRKAWEATRSDILTHRDKRYFTVPMARIHNNDVLLSNDQILEANEEPQLAFRCDAPLRFDPSHPYGRRPKVEMLLHLGIPGEWTNWFQDPFDVPPRKVSAEGYRVGTAGWVVRLASGKERLEAAERQAQQNRTLARAVAIRSTIDKLESVSVASRLSSEALLCYDTASVEEPADADRDEIELAAEDALNRGPYSVTDKPEGEPSGNFLHHFHPAPYRRPDNSKTDGIPNFQRIGQQSGGTEIYSEDRFKFDRTPLQRFFYDTIALSLAASITGQTKYREHAERLTNNWFSDPNTCMNRHLNWAQVHRGLKDIKGTPPRIIETKDFYYFFDALRLLGNKELTECIKAWSEKYFVWLRESNQGHAECKAPNYRGTCYDLQTASLAAFLKDINSLQEINLRAQARLWGTITADGEQSHEMRGTLTQHYCVFNLQSWINLFDLLESCGLRPWESSSAERLVAGIRFTLTESKNRWKHTQIELFDTARLVPLNYALTRRTGENILGDASEPAVFLPQDGIPPFWRLTHGLELHK